MSKALVRLVFDQLVELVAFLEIRKQLSRSLRLLHEVVVLHRLLQIVAIEVSRPSMPLQQGELLLLSLLRQIGQSFPLS